MWRSIYYVLAVVGAQLPQISSANIYRRLTRGGGCVIVRQIDLLDTSKYALFDLNIDPGSPIIPENHFLVLLKIKK